MNVLISGGCKNGKTSFAQDIAVKLSPEGNRYYVATMIPTGEEDYARIRNASPVTSMTVQEWDLKRWRFRGILRPA